MAKWNKEIFLKTVKSNCEIRIANTITELVKFTELNADSISWGRGEGYGTMTYKCKSIDFGIVPLVHVTSNGQIKFPLNYLKSKIQKKEIHRDFQLKLESNFMMYFDEDVYPADIFFTIDELFVMKVELDRFMSAILGVSASLHQ